MEEKNENKMNESEKNVNEANKIKEDTVKNEEVKKDERENAQKTEEVKKDERSNAQKTEEVKQDEKEKKFKQVKGNNQIKEEKGKNKKQEVKKEKIKKEKVKKEKKPKEKNDNKGILARILAIIIILLVIVGLIYLAIPTPEKTLNGLLQDLKEGKTDKISQYTNNEELILSEELGIGEDEKEIEKYAKTFFGSLEWKIKSVNKEKEEATMEIEITNKDYETAFKNYIQTMFQKFLNNQNISEEEQKQLLIDELNKDSIGTKTVTVNIKLTKTNGNWRIVKDDNLLEAIYPGLQEGINSISNLLTND